MKIIDNFVIVKQPDDSCLDSKEIEDIVFYTKNTWQPDRRIEEIRRNTIQGKKAEYVIEQIINNKTSFCFVSYDSIRKDNRSKHAPFDGIIFHKQISERFLEECINLINTDVTNNDVGQISPETRSYLENNGIFFIEIKSSLLLTKRDYKCINNNNTPHRTNQDYIALCDYIKNFYDYFTYPSLCRTSDTITDFYSYIDYVRNKYFSPDTKAVSLVNKVIEEEFDNACTIYTRVFFDNISNEILVPGYITKIQFFSEPRIKKMPSEKSQYAIYYMFHMNQGKSLLELDSDKEIAEYSTYKEKNKLFNTSRQVRCKYCGNLLKFLESKKNRKFLYRCESCSKWYKTEEIYPINMK